MTESIQPFGRVEGQDVQRLRESISVSWTIDQRLRRDSLVVDLHAFLLPDASSRRQRLLIVKEFPASITAGTLWTIPKNKSQHWSMKDVCCLIAFQIWNGALSPSPTLGTIPRSRRWDSRQHQGPTGSIIVCCTSSLPAGRWTHANEIETCLSLVLSPFQSRQKWRTKEKESKKIQDWNIFWLKRGYCLFIMDFYYTFQALLNRRWKLINQRPMLLLSFSIYWSLMMSFHSYFCFESLCLLFNWCMGKPWKRESVINEDVWRSRMDPKVLPCSWPLDLFRLWLSYGSCFSFQSLWDTFGSD